MACKRSKGMSSYNAVTSNTSLACERALRGALEAGRQKEGELAITSLKFEYLHRKSPFERLIGEDDISNEVTWYVFTTLQISQGLASCETFLVLFSGTWIRIP